MRRSLLALLFFTVCPLLVAQQSLNNDAVIKLAKAGLSDDLIVSTINAQSGTYDTSPDGLIGLKTAGVSDKVVAAMVARTAAPPPAPPPPVATAPPTAAPQPAPQALEPPSPPPPPFHSTDGKIRVYVTDHPMFESNGIAQASGNRHGGSAAAVSHTQAGDDPRVVEVEADIMKVCPPYILASNNQDRADYILVFRRRGGARTAMFAFGGLTGLALAGGMKVDGASLFQPDGDMLFATKQNTVEKSIRETCAHIPLPSAAPAAPAPALAPIPAPPPPAPGSTQAQN